MSTTLRQLQVFAAVVDELGFGAAAEKLQMSQSAVSHTLAALERATGTPLVRRSPAAGATGIGEDLLPHARSVLAAARAFESAVDKHRGRKDSGMVRLAAAPTASHRLVPELLGLWREQLPGIDIRLFEGGDDEIAEWLETGVVDAAILIDPDPMPKRGLILARDDFRAVVRADHPLARTGLIDLEDLLEDPLLVSSSGCEPQIKQLHSMIGARYAPAQRVHELSTLLSMVEAHLGVAVMPSLATTMLPDTLTMVELQPRLERSLALTGPTGRPWHPLVEQMRDAAARGRS